MGGWFLYLVLTVLDSYYIIQFMFKDELINYFMNGFLIK